MNDIREQLLVAALKLIANWRIADPDGNDDAANMSNVARIALEAVERDMSHRIALEAVERDMSHRLPLREQVKRMMVQGAAQKPAQADEGHGSYAGD